MTEITPTTHATQRAGAPGRLTRQRILGILAFALQRLAFGMFTLLAIILLTYLGLEMAGGTEFGPALQAAIPKTVDYLGNLAQGNLGVSTNATSAEYPRPVAEVLPEVASRSLVLLGVSLALATVVGTTLGLWSAYRRHSHWSLVTLIASLVGVSLPSFFAALLLQEFLIRWTRWAGSNLLPLGGFGWDKRIILPALVLAARPVAQVTRITFNAVGDALQQDYVRTARSKGLRAGRVLRAHVVRNSAVPILTTIGVSLRFSLASLPVVEYFFGWQGMGFLLLKGISRRDDNLTVILLLTLGGLFILINLALEVAYRLIDPRLRQEGDSVKERTRPADALRGLWIGLQDALADNPISRWWRGLRAGREPSPFRAILEQNGQRLETAAADLQAVNWRSWRRGTVGNLPFMIGGTLVLLLLVVFIFAPRLAPHSPYTTHGLEMVEGVLTAPPFEPGATYPWGTDMLGRDMLSLVLVGAQQTLLLAALVVLARMLLAFVLGSLAGWLSGSWIDRAVSSLAEIIAAVPTLLLAMILILALGIRAGVRPFLIALCLVGWDEIMQFVRGQVLSIRSELFIESAVAVGARTPRIIVGHVLPNLLSNLISLAALEMGAVLMLLGELGFVSIFIGGGAFAELNTRPGAPRYHYSDVPEWGSLLSSIRLYARAYPWTGIYPALAFFVSILGFNLFGEGLRRLMETVGVQFTRLVNRYTLGLAAVAVLAMVWMQGNTGAAAVYRKQARVFDGEMALAHVQALTAPEMDGRSLGTEGLDHAVEYIRSQFEKLGLQPAGEDFSYFQPRQRAFEVLGAVPTLEIGDGGESLVYRQDYAEFLGPDRVLGEIQAPIRLITWKELIRGQWYYHALRTVNLKGEIGLFLEPEQALLIRRSAMGGLVLVDDDQLAQRGTLSGVSPVISLTGSDTYGHDLPLLAISEATADRILRGAGTSVADLRRQVENLERDQLLEITISDPAVRLNVQGTAYESVAIPHIIGHLPGQSSSSYDRSLNLDTQVVIVMAQYDCPPLSPDGVPYPAANDNASGVALMLEIIRTMRAADYEPYRTFLFVAYTAEGEEGGNPVFPPDVTNFMASKYGFADLLTIEAVVDIRGVGAGDGDGLLISASGSLRLANLFEAAAGRMGVPAVRSGEQVDISIVYDDAAGAGQAHDAPQVGVHWQGWEETARTAADTLDTISAEKLERSGRAITLALMTMGRELRY